MKLFILAVFTLNLFLSPAAAQVDFCNTEPRLEVQTRTCPANNRPQVRFKLGFLSVNPYHSFHDFIWVVATYVTHCLPPKADVTISIARPREHIDACPLNHTRPLATIDVPAPCWPLGVLQAMLLRTGGRIISAKTRDGSGVDCYDKVISIVDAGDNYDLGFKPPKGYERRAVGKFRIFSWYARPCLGQRLNGECRVEKDGSNLEVRLPEEMISKALLYLRESVWKMHNIPAERPEGGTGPIHLLLYDRMDTYRRIWRNADELHAVIKKDKRLDVRYIHKTPESLEDQVNLYSWADIIVAPHGAAMANTIVVRPDVTVVEIFKHCGNQTIEAVNAEAHRWTGWHAHLMNVSLLYASCYKKQGATGPVIDPVSEEEVRLVSVAKIQRVIETAIQQQQTRLERIASSRVKGKWRPIESVERRPEWESSTNVETKGMSKFGSTVGIKLKIVQSKAPGHSLYGVMGLAVFVLWMHMTRRCQRPNVPGSNTLKR